MPQPDPKELQLLKFARSILRPRSAKTVTEWCEEQVVIPPPQTQSPGPFSIASREFSREVLDSFADHRVTDVVLCFGSQSGKTTILMAGVTWVIVEDPCGLVWGMPNVELARSFASNRWIPVLKATPLTSAMIPEGANRHEFKKLEQAVGGSIINFIGSNSPANLASRPARRIILDEVDKFDEGGRGEADAVNLAEQRTKDFSLPQRWKTSTPTITEGLIWQDFLKGDRRRYEVPCPHCSGWVIFAWSQAYSVLPATGNEAYVHWDKDAKQGGVWNLEKVRRSAHALCPHCKGKITDGNRTRMVRAGRWTPTNPNAPSSYRSYHLPSMYASSPETTFGRMAVKFLQQKASLKGLQGFINGDLAEPYEMQDTLGNRTEIVADRIEVDGDGWAKLMTVDCQASDPAFWYVVRRWQNGHSEGLAAGSADTWDEVEQVQKKHGVPDDAVIVDSGFGAREDAEVYRQCAQHSIIRPVQDSKPLCVGWMPSKGQPGRKKWRDPEGVWQPWFVRKHDPYAGTSLGGKSLIFLFELSTDYFKDILANMRARKGPYRWSVRPEVATETYWRHMDAEHLVTQRNRVNGKVTLTWVPRSSHWPNHIFDCEVLQVAGANFFNLLSIEEPDHDHRLREP